MERRGNRTQARCEEIVPTVSVFPKMLKYSFNLAI